MLRYKLRTLLILLAVLPPLLWFGWTKYERQRALQTEREYRAAVAKMELEQRAALERWRVLSARTSAEGQLMPAEREAFRRAAPPPFADDPLAGVPIYDPSSPPPKSPPPLRRPAGE